MTNRKIPAMALSVAIFLLCISSASAYRPKKDSPTLQWSEVVPTNKGYLEIFVSQQRDDHYSRPPGKGPEEVTGYIFRPVRTVSKFRYTSSDGLTLIARAVLDSKGLTVAMDLPNGQTLHIDHEGLGKRRLEIGIDGPYRSRDVGPKVRKALAELKAELLSNPRFVGSSLQFKGSVQTRDAFGCFSNLIFIDASVLAAMATCGACPVTGLSCLACVGSIAGGLAAGLGAFSACGDALGGGSEATTTFVCVEHPDHPDGYLCWREGEGDKVEIRP